VRAARSIRFLAAVGMMTCDRAYRFDLEPVRADLFAEAIARVFGV
jgi:hypothetical protein